MVSAHPIDFLSESEKEPIRIPLQSDKFFNDLSTFSCNVTRHSASVQQYKEQVRQMQEQVQITILEIEKMQASIGEIHSAEPMPWQGKTTV